MLQQHVGHTVTVDCSCPQTQSAQTQTLSPSHSQTLAHIQWTVNQARREQLSGGDRGRAGKIRLQWVKWQTQIATITATTAATRLSAACQRFSCVSNIIIIIISNSSNSSSGIGSIITKIIIIIVAPMKMTSLPHLRPSLAQLLLSLERHPDAILTACPSASSINYGLLAKLKFGLNWPPIQPAHWVVCAPASGRGRD